MGAVLTIHGKQYDTEKDFTWEELMLVEDVGGVPLGRDGAFDYSSVVAGLVFVVMKREDTSLTWEEFVKQPIDVTDGDAAKPATASARKPRPTKPA